MLMCADYHGFVYFNYDVLTEFTEICGIDTIVGALNGM